MNDILKLLKSIPIFSKLNNDELEVLKKISTIKYLKNGNILFYENDISNNIHMLLHGQVEVYKINLKGREIVLKQFSPFEFIAEVSNYNNINFPASAKSIGDSTILVIDYKEFEEQFLYHKDVAPFVLKSMANKVINLEKIISSNLTMDATQRIAKFIYNNEKCLNCAKHHQIADNLNITPVTFSRILKKFKKEEIITLDKNKFIVNKDLLKKQFS
ncbi:MAG: Crp/Fnr family transcriptional regulator [Campylobacterota bacterium]|nr:Crp/Fnr family transcriptional regulator [Campylobacterota bacterium]